jgi:uncharacterized protein (DUF4415 family)
MTASKKNTFPAGVDLDEIPDMSTPIWQKIIDAAPLSRGRPRIAYPKLSTTLRLDSDIIAKFKEGGPGWQTRINHALKDWLARR